MLIKLIIYNYMKKILTLLTIGIVCLTSCKEEITQESFISIYPTELIFDADGGEQSITINCADSWQLSGSADWCNVSSTYGKNGDYVYFSVDKSQDTDEKSVTYTFRSGTSSQELTVVQKQKDALTITSSNFEVPAEGQEISIEVKSNIDFDYEITLGQEWIHKIETKSLETTVLNFFVDENQEFKDRDGEISISSGEITEKIKIHQAESVPNISIGTTTFDVPAAGETISIEIDANVAYSYNIPQDVDWLEFSQETENGIEFTVDKNNLLENREATIEFYNNEYNLSSAVTIKQDAYGLEDMLQTIHVATKGTLSNVLKENGIENAAYLKITGELNDIDFFTLNEMAKNNLIYLDVSEIDMTVLPDNIMKNTNLSYMILPYGLIEIGQAAFSGSKIKKIEIPETVEIIDDYAFQYCSVLTDANIPANLKTLGYSAFRKCSSLKGSITIPATLETLSRKIFEGTSIQSVTFKKGKTPISVTNLMFNDCHNLTSVFFEPGCLIQNFEAGCFADCSALLEITIPSSVRTIGIQAFSGCTSLREVNFTENSNLYLIQGGSSYDEDSKQYSSNGAFAGCGSLQKIIIPASVKIIEGSAFYGCSALSSIIFEDNSQLTELGTANISLDDNSMRFRGYGPFTGTSIESIIIPKGVKELTGGALCCSTLKLVQFEIGSELEEMRGFTSYNLQCTPLGVLNGGHNLTLDLSNCARFEKIEDGALYNASISLCLLGTSKPPKLTYTRDTYKSFNKIGTTDYAVLKVPDESVSTYQNSYWAYYFSSISGLSD